MLAKEQRTELLGLLSTLKTEIGELSKTHSEQAQSITAFTEVSTHEATRQERDPQLLRLSLEGLSASVQGFETSHPKLVEIVNCNQPDVVQQRSMTPDLKPLSSVDRSASAEGCLRFGLLYDLALFVSRLDPQAELCCQDLPAVAAPSAAATRRCSASTSAWPGRRCFCWLWVAATRWLRRRKVLQAFSR